NWRVLLRRTAPTPVASSLPAAGASPPAPPPHPASADPDTAPDTRKPSPASVHQPPTLQESWSPRSKTASRTVVVPFLRVRCGSGRAVSDAAERIRPPCHHQ